MLESNTKFPVCRRSRSKTPFWRCHNLNPDFHENHCRTLRTMELVQAWPSSTRRVNKDRFVTMIVLKFYTRFWFFMPSISRTEYKYCLYRVQMWRFLTGVKPPPRKKAKLSEMDARSEKENRKREPQKNIERQATLVAVHTRWHDDLQLLCWCKNYRNEK